MMDGGIKTLQLLYDVDRTPYQNGISILSIYRAF
jgi:hypothetical protein